MHLKSPYELLAESTAADLAANTEGYITESEVRARMSSIEELSESIVFGPEMVPVFGIDEGYYTDINSIAPFMKSYNIKTVAEALDRVAQANNLPEKSVGLMIESDDYINTLLEKAEAAKATKGKNAANKLLNKAKALTDVPKDLIKKGFPVKKKKSDKPASAKDECSEPVKDECTTK